MKDHELIKFRNSIVEDYNKISKKLISIQEEINSTYKDILKDIDSITYCTNREEKDSKLLLIQKYMFTMRTKYKAESTILEGKEFLELKPKIRACRNIINSISKLLRNDAICESDKIRILKEQLCAGKSHTADHIVCEFYEKILLELDMILNGKIKLNEEDF